MPGLPAGLCNGAPTPKRDLRIGGFPCHRGYRCPTATSPQVWARSIPTLGQRLNARWVRLGVIGNRETADPLDNPGGT